MTELKSKSFTAMKRNFIKYIMCASVATSMLGFVSCDDNMEGTDWVANSALQLDEYMAANDSTLGLFLDIVDHADMRGMVHAYGHYTLFVPTNEAVCEYLGVSDAVAAENAIQQLAADSARNIVCYHMLEDTLHTTDMIDTRLTYPNMSQDYLTSSYATGSYVINRNALITAGDISTGNGVLHVIDHVLHRPTYSVKDVFTNIGLYDSEAKGYSIMTEIMKEILDSLDLKLEDIVGTGTKLTFMVQPDSVMQAEKLTTLDLVKERLEFYNTKNYTTETLLKNWIGYHFINGRYFKADLTKGQMNTFTSFPKTDKTTSGQDTIINVSKVITISSIGEKIFLNRYESLGENGIEVSTIGNMVDFTCSNGVIQSLNGELEVIERAATRINWDMADQPEIRSNKGYQKAGTTLYFYSTLSADASYSIPTANSAGYVPTDLSMMSWSGKNTPNVEYNCSFVPKLGDINFDGHNVPEFVYGDKLNFRMATHVMQYLEIQTPTLVEGKYKVWLRWRPTYKNSTGEGSVKVSFLQSGQEDQVFGTAVLSQMGAGSSSRNDDEQQSAKGYYQPQAYLPSMKFMNCLLLATIDVKSEGSHVLRLEALDDNNAGSGARAQWFDMLYFIPVADDQVYPRVMIDGNDARIYRYDRDENGALKKDETRYIDITGFNANYRTHIFPGGQCPVVAGTANPGECPQTWCINHDDDNFDASGNLK